MSCSSFCRGDRAPGLLLSFPDLGAKPQAPCVLRSPRLQFNRATHKTPARNVFPARLHVPLDDKLECEATFGTLKILSPFARKAMLPLLGCPPAVETKTVESATLSGIRVSGRRMKPTRIPAVCSPALKV